MFTTSVAMLVERILVLFIWIVRSWRETQQSFTTLVYRHLLGKEDEEEDEPSTTYYDPTVTTEETVEILRHQPSRRHERDLWMRVVRYFHETSLSVVNLFGDCAPQEIRADRDIMLAACQIVSPRMVRFIDTETLGKDRAFLERVLFEDLNILAHLRHDVQKHFPDLVSLALERLARQPKLGIGFVTEVALNIAPAFWEDRSFQLAWFEAGLPFVGHETSSVAFGATWKDDREIVLRIAQFCQEKFRLHSFAVATCLLRSDKTFMLEVLQHAPSLLCCVKIALQQDPDLFLVAFAGDSGPLYTSIDWYLRQYDHMAQSLDERNDVMAQWLDVERDLMMYLLHRHPEPRRLQFVHQFHAKLQSKLETFDVFRTAFLPGMLQSSGSALAMLEQGTETSTYLKLRIAEFVGAMTNRRELRLTRQANKNLTAYFNSKQSKDHRRLARG